MRYQFQALVERQVFDTVTISVETDDGFRNALLRAKKALSQYPSPVDDSGIRSIYTENRENKNTNVLLIERRIPINDGGT